MKKDIKITDDMLAAGASVLCGFHTEFADEKYWAEKVFAAMMLAKHPEKKGPCPNCRTTMLASVNGTVWCLNCDKIIRRDGGAVGLA